MASVEDEVELKEGDMEGMVKTKAKRRRKWKKMEFKKRNKKTKGESPKKTKSQREEKSNIKPVRKGPNMMPF